MNSYGMVGDDPMLKLETVDDLESHMNWNTTWAKIQPLLFQYVDDDNTTQYFFATIEDIWLHVTGKETNYLQDLWKDEYLGQINQFVYNKSDSGGSWSVTEEDTIAKNGLGATSTAPTSTASALSAMQQYAGTLVGSTGICQTPFNNTYVQYGSLGAGGLIIVCLLIYWIVYIAKAARGSTTP